MTHRDTAARVLFGSKILNNAIRGHYIEALAFDALQRHDQEHSLPLRWRYVGLSWGPWDLQRGTAQDKNRVRIQVRAKASQQLWEPGTPSRQEYDLGWKNSKKLPKYFARDFDPLLIGECELVGYRTDLFLLAWHGPNPATDAVIRGDDQSDPNNYDYFILRAPKSADPNSSPLRRLSIRTMFEEKLRSANFSGLADALNGAADEFLRQ